jgi:hypothetical protein
VNDSNPGDGPERVPGLILCAPLTGLLAGLALIAFDPFDPGGATGAAAAAAVALMPYALTRAALRSLAPYKGGAGLSGNLEVPASELVSPAPAAAHSLLPAGPDSVGHPAQSSPQAAVSRGR